MAKASAQDVGVDPSVTRNKAIDRWRTRILIGVAINAALAVVPLVRIARLHPTLRALEWPSLAADGGLFLAPAVVATYTAVTVINVVDVAIVMNFAFLIAFPQSLVVAPIILIPLILYLFAWPLVPAEKRPLSRVSRAMAALLCIATALLISLAPQRHILWETASSSGRVIRATASEVSECPLSLGQTLRAGEDGGASGCDPITAAPAAEAGVLFSTMAVILAVGPAGRWRVRRPNPNHMP